jgi:hypothetical protein
MNSVRSATGALPGALSMSGRPIGPGGAPPGVLAGVIVARFGVPDGVIAAQFGDLGGAMPGHGVLRMPIVRVGAGVDITGPWAGASGHGAGAVTGPMPGEGLGVGAVVGAEVGVAEAGASVSPGNSR